MPPDVVVCPVCKQKLAFHDYFVVGTEVVCTNCETNLRIVQRRPLRVEVFPIEATFDADSRPESYG